MNFKIWKTITLGIHKTSGSYLRALFKTNLIWSSAKDIVDKTRVSRDRVRLDLVILSVAELGFRRKTTRLGKIYARSKKLGLKLCPSEVGLALRLAYWNQPKHEWLHIAMKPIANKIFEVAHADGSRWLCGEDGNLDGLWGLNSRFIFTL